MICEDVQWIDPTSLELLDRLITRITALPALLLVTFRPEFQPPWIGRRHVTAHSLGRLNREDGGEIINRLAGGKALPSGVTEQILDRTDGVPLFVEELTKMVLESGLLREEQGSFVLNGPLRSFVVPDTLQASLVARLDCLTSSKEVAHIGAAIGREFAFDLLAAVSTLSEHEIQVALSQLISSGLIFERGSPPHSTYIFKHALVQDAAYGTLLRSRRQHLHGRIGGAVEEKFPEIAASHPEIVARHYTEAGDLAKAISYWLKAGHLAGSRSANFEAKSHLTKALELLQRLPPGPERDRKELILQSLLGAALIATKGYAAPEPIAAYERAVELIRVTGDTSRRESVFFGTFSIYYNLAAFEKTLELARELLRLAEQRNETTSRALALGMLAALHTVLGEFNLARDYGTQSIALYKSARSGPSEWHYVVDLVTSAKCILAIAMWHLGALDQSSALERDALASAASLNHQPTTGLILSFAALLAFHSRDLNALRDRSARLQAHARKHSMSQLLAWATCLDGLALIDTDPDRATTLIRSGLAQCETMNNKAFWPVWLTGLAQALFAVGCTNEALRTIQEALETADRTGERWMDAELWRLGGRIRQSMRDVDSKGEPEICFRRALFCAEKQQSKMLALRAATSLAEFFDRQGCPTKARDLLMPYYNSVAGGFDVPDLKQAKSLLDLLR